MDREFTPTELDKLLADITAFNPDFDYEKFFADLKANVEELYKRLQYMQLKDLFDKQKRYRIEQFLDLLAELNEVLKSEEYFEQ